MMKMCFIWLVAGEVLVEAPNTGASGAARSSARRRRSGARPRGVLNLASSGDPRLFIVDTEGKENQGARAPKSTKK